MTAFYGGLAEVFEIESAKITNSFELGSEGAPWDSLSIVTTIALVDDCFGVVLAGKLLGECKTVGDIEGLIAESRKA